MQRILSVFNLLKRVGFALLLLGANIFSHAQPQAPIVWGEVEVLYNNPDWPSLSAGKITAQGDTIVLHGGVDSTSFFPALRISGDDGLTWSPWSIFTEDLTNNGQSPVAFAPDGIYMMIDRRTPAGAALRRSTDLGWTWEPPCNYFLFLSYLKDAIGESLYCITGHPGVVWTVDGGCSYSEPMETGFEGTAIEDLAIGGGWMHAVGSALGGGPGMRLVYARAQLGSGEFEEIQEVHPDIYWSELAHVDCDDSGTVIILTPASYTAGNLWDAQLLEISRDYGETWTERDTLTPEQTSGPGVENLGHEGSRWLVAWGDSTTLPGFERDGMLTVFSANKGRSWYPRQQVHDELFVGGYHVQVEIRGNRVRIYTVYAETNGDWDHRFVRWEGILSIDSLAPVISANEVLPLLVEHDTLLNVSITASDNDSLWLAQFVAQRQGGDSVIINLERAAIDQYDGTWSVPPDTAIWTYYYRVEDMWEHVTTTEVQMLYVGEISAAPDREPMLPSITFDSYPNPSNGEVTFSLSGLRIGSRVEIDIFDLLGRRVGNVASTFLTGGEQRIHWNTHGLSGEPLPSGIYFAKLGDLQQPQATRIAIIR